MKKYRIKPIRPRIGRLIKSMKRTPIKSLSLGLMVLGIGFMLLFVVGILSHSGDFLRQLDRQHSAQSTFAKQPDAFAAQEEVSDQPNREYYTVNPSEGDHVGTIEIPALKREIDIFQGTGAEELAKGGGHFTKSVLPGEKDNCVLSGHNDSVFTKLDSLEIGDLIIIQTGAGEFTYKINGMRVVDKADRTVIVPTEEATLTLTTCYPFVTVGPAPERYIVTAQLISH